MKLIHQLLFTACSAICSIGCGAMSMTVQPAKMQIVKSTAIVGFRGTNNMKRDGDKGKLDVLKQANAIAGAAEAVSGDLEKRKKAQGNNLYALVSKRIEKELNWQVMPNNTIAENDEYRSLHNKFTQEPGVDLQKQWMIDAEGVVWSEFALRWSAEERGKLMDALKVDTLTMVGVEFETGDTGGVSIAGIGSRSFHPRAIVRLATYDRGSAEPIWEAKYARGEATEKGLESVMGVDTYDQETELFGQATESALDELFKQYRGQN